MSWNVITTGLSLEPNIAAGSRVAATYYTTFKRRGSCQGARGGLQVRSKREKSAQVCPLLLARHGEKGARAKSKLCLLPESFQRLEQLTLASKEVSVNHSCKARQKNSSQWAEDTLEKASE
jgi:hypothetical protein